MLQAQGLRPLDPYKTLQLHPHAPRDLVVEAYWTLVARQKQRLATSASAGAEIAELNAAYGLLMDDASRSAYDAEHGLDAMRVPVIRLQRRAIGMLGIGATATLVSDHADFYHLLRVDRGADVGIIEGGRMVMMREASGPELEDQFLRELITEAHRTLANPQLRARYDIEQGFAAATRLEDVDAPAPPEVAAVVADEDAPRRPTPIVAGIVLPDLDDEPVMTPAAEAQVRRKRGRKSAAQRSAGGVRLPAIFGRRNQAPAERVAVPMHLAAATVASNGSAALALETEAPAEDDAPAPPTLIRAAAGERMAAEETAAPASALTKERERQATAVAPVIDAQAATEARFAALASTPQVEPQVAEMAPQTEIASPADSLISTIVTTPEAATVLSAPAAPSDAAAAPDAETPVVPSAQPRGLLGRLGRARTDASDVSATHEDAGDVRLRQLRDEPTLAAMGDAPPAAARQIAVAELAFTAGPRAGVRVQLGEDAVTIGAGRGNDVVLEAADGVAPEHARIWQHGEHFVFRQIDGAGTIIAGERMLLPMVILDHGDVIAIGPHSMQFRRLVD